MVHQERLATGEKWFVFSTMLVLGVEGVLAIIHNALHFTWPGLILGAGGFFFMMYLANRLYAGDRNAYNLALVWVGFQLVYALLVLGLMLSSEQGAATARSLGAPVVWGALLKGGAYTRFIYPGPGLRRFNDLDLLLRPQALAKARAALERMGYAVSGGVSALTGALLLGWSGGGFIGVGQPYLFMTLAAVVIGGTSLLGGYGGYGFTVIGVLVLQVLTSFLVGIGLDYQWQQFIFGLLILPMVALYARSPHIRTQV